MMTPRTPSKNGKGRLIPLTVPTAPTSGSPRPRPPSTSTSISTPPRSPITTRIKPSTATASPQVRAALAAMRKQHAAAAARPPLAPASTSSQADIFSPEDNPNDFSAAASSREEGKGPARTAAGVGLSRRRRDDDEGGDAGVEWGMKTIAMLVEGAKKTGRLNVASRSLTAIPPIALSSLVPLSSEYHPSRRTSDRPKTTPSSASKSTVDFSMNDSSNWYEQVDLKTLNMSNNEIVDLEPDIAGFEDLENLDLHNNLLLTLPTSLSQLLHLTILNLASNKITSFPTLLLSLTNLRELNLSSNALESLWEPDWVDHLDTSTQTKSQWSPSRTPQSADKSSGFWEGFPSSPSMSKSNGKSPGIQYQAPLPLKLMGSKAPWPRLTVLNVSDNRLSGTTFSKEDFELPLNLITLDLSNNKLRDSDLPLNTFGTLPNLTSLDLSGNSISDNLFISPSPSSPTTQTPTPNYFPSLTSLDLSRNPIDSLQITESSFRIHVGRLITYVGMPKVAMNIIRATEGRDGVRRGWREGRGMEVKVVDCLLREEQAWRRREYDRTEVVVVEDGLKEAERKGKEEVEVEEMRRGVEGFQVGSTTTTTPTLPVVEVLTAIAPSPALSLAEESSAPPPYSPSPKMPSESTPPTSPDPQKEADLSDPALQLITSNFNASRSSLNLSKRSLSALPIPTTGIVPTSLQPLTIDLSSNLFKAIPFGPILNWTWSHLRSLNLSSNKLVSIDLIVGPARLDELTDLDLSNNWLESTLAVQRGETTSREPLLSLLATIAPKLVKLDLSMNRLSSTEGIEGLLIPVAADGIQELGLRGNKISNIEALTRIAGSMEHAAALSWKCRELDLSDNEIGRLPPLLGHLPHDLNLKVLGNTFRIPRQDFIENTTSRGLLEWLQDRC